MHADTHSFQCTASTLLFVIIIIVSLTVAARGHDVYTHWTTKDGVSCCHNKDCGPARTRELEGRLQVFHEGQWLDVPADAMRPYEAPDGQAHVCVYEGRVLCFVGGMGT